VLAVDQDGPAARRVIDRGSEQAFVKGRPGGTWYVGIFNTDTAAPRTFAVGLAGLGLSYAVRAADLWTGRALGVVRGSYVVTVPPGGVSLIAARLIPGSARSPSMAVRAGGQRFAPVEGGGRARAASGRAQAK
jgi:Alpha galactosidase C-terminal beta sandwich domain